MRFAALVCENELRVFAATLLKNRLRNAITNQWSPTFPTFDVARWNNKYAAPKFLQINFPFTTQIACHIIAYSDIQIEQKRALQMRRQQR
jgi:hypothetical protein